MEKIKQKDKTKLLAGVRAGIIRKKLLHIKLLEGIRDEINAAGKDAMTFHRFAGKLESRIKEVDSELYSRTRNLFESAEKSSAEESLSIIPRINNAITQRIKFLQSSLSVIGSHLEKANTSVGLLKAEMMDDMKEIEDFTRVIIQTRQEIVEILLHKKGKETLDRLTHLFETWIIQHQRIAEIYDKMGEIDDQIAKSLSEVEGEIKEEKNVLEIPKREERKSFFRKEEKKIEKDKEDIGLAA